jgi:hypothetical protein
VLKGLNLLCTPPARCSSKVRWGSHKFQAKPTNQHGEARDPHFPLQASRVHATLLSHLSLLSSAPRRGRVSHKSPPSFCFWTSFVERKSVVCSVSALHCHAKRCAKALKKETRVFQVRGKGNTGSRTLLKRHPVIISWRSSSDVLRALPLFLHV